MRRIAVLPALTGLALTGAVAAAGPAVAAPDPATPYRYEDCGTFTDFDGVEYQYCFTGRGVVKEQSNPSGRELFHVSGVSDYTLSSGGAVVYEGSSRTNDVLHYGGSGAEVWHGNGEGEFTFDGTTCTYTFNYTYANGELRHDASDFECTP